MVEEVVKFLAATPAFHIATVDADGRPRNRPFGFSMEYQGHLVFCTGSFKKFYKEIEKTPYVEVSSFNPATGEWVRVHGKTTVIEDKAGKEKVFTTVPQIGEIYKSPDNPVFKIFSVEGQADFYKFGPDQAPFKTIPLK
jgi:uncharacterized pyridoxamine 5'-phosphate oxidase family protein